MGTRAQVRVIQHDGDIYLYQHWDGSDLPDIINQALRRSEDRWEDEEYLTRAIFSEMIKDHIYETNGYGIGLREHVDIDILVTVDVGKQVVMVDRDKQLKIIRDKPISFKDAAHA